MSHSICVWIALCVAASIALGVQQTKAQGSVESDRAALVVLYDSTGGDNWRDNTNWESDEPLGEWYGVNTDHNGRVKELLLRINNLTGSIPSEIGNLDNLEFLHMGDNQLSGSIPSEIGNLDNLTYLHMYRNQLSGPIPSEIGNLSNLKVISLSNNNLDKFIPSEVGKITNLETFLCNLR